MNMQKKQLKKMTGACCLAVVMGLALNAAAAPSITGVKAQQRYPWNGKFDISYTATGVDEECVRRIMTPALTVYAVEQKTHITNMALAAYLSGDTVISNGTHKLVWDMDAQGIFQGVVSTNLEVFVSVDAELRGVQLWAGGPYWAEYNVGATKPEEYGYYFSWGDTVGYKLNADTNGWISAKDGTAHEFSAANCPTYGKDNATLTSMGYLDASGNLVPAHDAAVANCDAPWRMPTLADMDALVDNCTATWITTNGVRGRLVTGKGNYANRSIFLPAAGDASDADPWILWSNRQGFYWSSAPNQNSYGYKDAFSFFFNGTAFSYGGGISTI